MRLALFFLFVSYISVNAQRKDIEVDIGDSFPAFELKNLNNKTVTLEDLKGKVIFLNTWFNGCKPCVEEMPELNKLSNKYKDRVLFLSMTLDNKEETKEFLKTHPYNFEHLVDAESFLKDVLGSKAYPRNIIIDRNGKIQFITYGLPHIKRPEDKEPIMSDFTFFEKPLLKVLSL
ncbi:TlpA disulfide reductase family protein [uncultured Aquimarina sp.]|uniref:TlpA family protein disulfide reductase n=1 Tax=uncultured Aquimarina sp. TaxID=575652 RepID=UPI002615D550|nr:TlpA disulfide reductase family protein [uncultured Aquimarina sp.]